MDSKSIIDAVQGVTAKWAKQRKAEERHASAEQRRREAMTCRYRSVTLKDAAWAATRSRFLVTQQVDPERFPGVIETDYIILDFAGAAQRHGSALRRRGFDGEFLTKYEASCLLNLAWNRGAIQRALARAGG